jgi:hypothetical protein
MWTEDVDSQRMFRQRRLGQRMRRENVNRESQLVFEKHLLKNLATYRIDRSPT